ncbi:MAG: helix-turn-helix domain-containing protein [Candidatus Sumerlaeia bacterium]
MLLDDLGKRIRERREKQGLKQQDIANALQVSPQAVSKWERGENGPDLAILGPLAKLLDVTTDWLLDAQNAGLDTFPATVFVSDISGAYKKSLGLAPSDFAAWINGHLTQMTEAVLRHDGIPVKYTGDGLLAFFSGSGHAGRAIESALLARKIVSPDLRVGLNSGEIYVGSMGHPDYARPDVMGETVNIAFFTREWAYNETKSGIAATEAVIKGAEKKTPTKKSKDIHFRGIEYSIKVFEIQNP